MRRRDLLIGTSAIGLAYVAKAAVSPLKALEKAPPGSPIVRAAIFPAIGFSRVGNSEAWFHAPEVPGLLVEPDGGFKDAQGRIKKQVQRFRLYGYDDKGRVVRELDAREARWGVHTANTKAAWYGFINAMDRGTAAPGIPGTLRNAFVPAEKRSDMLVIDAGLVAISGVSTNEGGHEQAYRMRGTFWQSLDVDLGHLQTDAQGRLLVFAADGVSRTALPQNPVRDFTNNDGWHDDWSDGLVRAEVEVDGTQIPCETAWIVCCGPKFAPQLEPIVTLYDVAREAMVAIGQMSAPTDNDVSFRRDVLPILRRAGAMQWVAAASFLGAAWNEIGDLSSPAVLASLARPGADTKVVRRKVFEAFRRPGGQDHRSAAIPMMLGDGVNYAENSHAWLTLTATQYRLLELWAAGHFVDDYEDAAADATTTVEDLPLALQPEALTRAALDACSGGAFHPGVEITWPIRHPELYQGRDETNLPFRIKVSRRPGLIQDLGLQLNPTNVFEGNPTKPADGAPIGPQAPGDLTRWMGVPWQGDAFSCQAVLTAGGFPTPVWWPALLPVDVLPEAFYHQLMRTDLSEEERLRFYHTRVPWARGAAGIGLHVEAGYTDGLRRMIELWSRMGVLVRRPGPKGLKGVPEAVYVETQRGSMDITIAQPPI